MLSLFSSLLITGVSGAIYNQLSTSMTNQAEISPVVFTNGEDTRNCGGRISENSIQVIFIRMPFAVESDIVITQLVNITNTDSSDHGIQVSVSAEDFGSELSSLQLYFVSPLNIETLVVEFDDSGNVVLEKVLVNILKGDEWAIKLVGHYDSGTSSSQSNTMTLNFQVTY